ncbi:hypothetical protein AB0N62_43940 [Streptomyces sp. NPDC093982]|uniref:hypothetical protein n=1 Tax=Streptomyces sp. NPDC093982 TaxID=3155077 RepID=UPI0034231681
MHPGRSLLELLAPVLEVDGPPRHAGLDLLQAQAGLLGQDFRADAVRMVSHRPGDLSLPEFGAHERPVFVLLGQFSEVLTRAGDDQPRAVELGVDRVDDESGTTADHFALSQITPHRSHSAG